MRRTKSRETTVQLLSFLFLPGVIIHELSHLLIAGILFIRVGEIEFVPKFIEDSKFEGVKLGSVAIAKTDPLRRAIIGIAPIFVGLVFILATTYFAINDKSFIHILGASGAIETVIRIILFYLLFAVSNTMFSSKKDTEGTLELILAGILITIIFYLIGVRIPLGFLSNNLLSEGALLFIKQQNVLLLIPLVIDVGILGAIKMIK